MSFGQPDDMDCSNPPAGCGKITTFKASIRYTDLEILRQDHYTGSMNLLEKPYLPGSGAAFALPLARYLPPLPAGMVSQWAQQGPPPGSWLLDPFGSHPWLALEAAQAGYRVLVASNNPILSFMLEVLASAPARAEFEAAIAALASSKRGEERLEPYIRSLYLTDCTACGQKVTAQGFIWQRDQTLPTAKIYRCPFCGDEGERSATPFDRDQLKLLGSDALTRSRALARVVMERGSEQAAAVEEALKTYLPRPLYVLTTLINKTEGLNLPLDRKKLLIALLISVCDDANTLWQHPAARPRPRQLTIPPLFRENNLWAALENASLTWSSQARAVTLTHWPQEPPPEGGICLYQGRIRTLLPLPQTIQPAAILTAVPRPNQAFWTLCAIWGGWLWGWEAVQPLRGALERLRYDWYWMAQALNSALSSANQKLPEGTPLFSITAEMTPGFFLSAFCAPQTAGFELQGMAYQQEADIAQFWWRSSSAARQPASANPKSFIQPALVDHFRQTAEPASTLQLFSLTLREMSARSQLPLRIQALTNDLLGRTQAILGEVLMERSVFCHISGRTQMDEIGLWFLQEPPTDVLPLADQVEKEIVSLLVKERSVLRAAVDSAVYAKFPGMRAPPPHLIQACLESYAQEDTARPGYWLLRDEDDPEVRRAELESVRQHLTNLGQRLGFSVEGGEPLAWKSAGRVIYLFYVTASCIFSRFVLTGSPLPPQQCVIVYPGGRTALLGVKQERDPRLKAALDKGWHLLKFRQLREIVEREQLDLALWEELLEGDPPSWETMTQMSMF